MFNNSVTSLGKSAFEGCENLSSVDIPNSVKNLQLTFYNCKNLTNVTIGSSVERMCATFFGCPKIKKIICLPTTPPIIESLYSSSSGNIYIFNSDILNKAKLYVSGEYIERYKSHTYWGQFVNIIPISSIPGDTNADGEVNIADINVIIDLILNQ